LTEKESGRVMNQTLCTGHIDPESASRILRKALRRVGIEGASTHSFRRTARSSDE